MAADFLGIINFSATTAGLLVFLTNVVVLELVIWAYVSNRYSRPGKMFLLGAIYVLLWVNLDSISALSPVFMPKYFYVAALWAQRGLHALLAIFFAWFYAYSLNFPEKNVLDKNKRLQENFQIAGWTFFFFISFTPLVISGVGFDSSLPMSIWAKTGPLFWLYVAAAALTLALSLSQLSRNRVFADPQNRRKALLATLGGGTFGVFNLIFNVVEPYFAGKAGYLGFFSLFIDYFLVILLGYVAYQAASKKLFGAKVVLAEIFVGLIGFSLMIAPFFVDFLWQQALLTVIFVMFCVFGYLFITGTVKEYREKEILEQKVAERTKELELAKRDLEEANLALEARVKNRTQELEKLNRTLEEKVNARTNDLEAKIDALEKFQRITIGRELKMMELKKDIEKLHERAGAPKISKQK